MDEVHRAAHPQARRARGAQAQEPGAGLGRAGAARGELPLAQPVVFALGQRLGPGRLARGPVEPGGGGAGHRLAKGQRLADTRRGVGAGEGRGHQVEVHPRQPRPVALGLGQGAVERRAVPERAQVAREREHAQVRHRRGGGVVGVDGLAVVSHRGGPVAREAGPVARVEGLLAGSGQGDGEEEQQRG